MITRERLKGAYSEGEALAIYSEARAGGDLAGFCRQYMHDEDYQVARNALWGLTKAHNDEIVQLQPMLNELIDLAMGADNSSVRRLALNLVERLEIGEDDVRTDFLDFCLEHMVDVAEYPGIQSLCMKLALRMCGYYPELLDELKRTIRDMDMAHFTPAVRSVRNRILAGKTILRRKI